MKSPSSAAESNSSSPSCGSSTISPSSSVGAAAGFSSGEDDGDGEEAALSAPGGSMAAARAAASLTSRGESEAGRGSVPARSGKLRMAAAAEGPLTQRAAASWARAAISGVAKVPSQMRDFLRGSRISDTHFPHARIRTPRYTGCRLLSRSRFRCSVAVPHELLLDDDEPEEEEEEDDALVSDSDGAHLIWSAIGLIKPIRKVRLSSRSPQGVGGWEDTLNSAGPSSL
ncbi:hypothetical protein MUK42_13318 [Musa troglodytarum]|uniref:Uncharacterized protein n=1 Tax=Musa troglodytarum TaxID=320322 RepID=A0A9E7KMV2_9LILI|nr:hypothetical protein MUK42_13318 [Musa troglodytarum]